MSDVITFTELDGETYAIDARGRLRIARGPGPDHRERPDLELVRRLCRAQRLRHDILEQRNAARSRGWGGANVFTFHL